MQEKANQSPEKEFSVIVTVAEGTSRLSLLQAGLSDMKELPYINAVSGSIRGVELGRLEEVEGVERIDFDSGSKW